MNKIKTVLITGATGKIGTDLCHQLNQKFEVRSGVRRLLDGLPNPVMCQLRDFDSVLAAMQGVDAVIHLAGQAWEREVYGLMIPDNITGCYNVFEAARQSGVKRVIFASTNHIVGQYLQEGITVDENVPVRPDSFYAVTKIFGEALGRFYAEIHGLSVISARIGWYLTPDELKNVSPQLTHSAWGLWISRRDMAHFMTRCLEVDHITYITLNCISDNSRNLLDLSKAKQILDYQPQDDSEIIIQKFGLDKA